MENLFYDIDNNDADDAAAADADDDRSFLFFAANDAAELVWSRDAPLHEQVKIERLKNSTEVSLVFDWWASLSALWLYVDILTLSAFSKASLHSALWFEIDAICFDLSFVWELLHLKSKPYQLEHKWEQCKRQH